SAALEENRDLRNQKRNACFGAKTDLANRQGDLRLSPESPCLFPHIGEEKVYHRAIAMGMRLKAGEFQPQSWRPGFQFALVRGDPFPAAGGHIVLKEKLVLKREDDIHIMVDPGHPVQKEVYRPAAGDIPGTGEVRQLPLHRLDRPESMMPDPPGMRFRQQLR